MSAVFGLRPAMRRFRIAFVVGSVMAASATVAPVAAATLTPPPPAFETCHVGGNGTVCVGNETEQGELEGTGVWCGTGADAFEIIDDGGTVLRHFERWYNADGFLEQRLVKATWLDSAWTNQVNGKRVPYRQAQVTVDVLAVPGDFSSAQSKTTGVVNFTLPGGGAIARNAGQFVFGPDGILEFRAGPQSILDYFIDGDGDALQPICDALSG